MSSGQVMYTTAVQQTRLLHGNCYAMVSAGCQPMAWNVRKSLNSGPTQTVRRGIRVAVFRRVSFAATVIQRGALHATRCGTSRRRMPEREPPGMGCRPRRASEVRAHDAKGDQEKQRAAGAAEGESRVRHPRQTGWYDATDDAESDQSDCRSHRADHLHTSPSPSRYRKRDASCARGGASAQCA